MFLRHVHLYHIMISHISFPILLPRDFSLFMNSLLPHLFFSVSKLPTILLPRFFKFLYLLTCSSLLAGSWTGPYKQMRRFVHSTPDHPLIFTCSVFNHCSTTELPQLPNHVSFNGAVQICVLGLPLLDL